MSAKVTLTEEEREAAEYAAWGFHESGEVVEAVIKAINSLRCDDDPVGTVRRTKVGCIIRVKMDDAPRWLAVRYSDGRTWTVEDDRTVKNYPIVHTPEEK